MPCVCFHTRHCLTEPGPYIIRDRGAQSNLHREGMRSGHGEAVRFNLPQPRFRRPSSIASGRKVNRLILDLHLVKAGLNVNRYDNMKAVTRNKLLDFFENTLKRDFVNDEQADLISCPIGGLADDPVAGIVDSCLSLSREDMRNIFDPVINLIIPLVQNQIDTIEQQDQLGLQVSV